MKLAYVSPLPPTRSGIADYSADLLPWLAQTAEVEVFCERPEAAPADLPPRFPPDAYPERRKLYDLTLYQLGNNPCHAASYALLKRYPGVVTLHDPVLHHFLATQEYGRELGYTLGAAAGMAARRGWQPVDPFAEPLNRRAIDLSLGVIVHSRYAAAAVQRANPQRPTAVIGQPVPLPPTAPPRSADGLIFGSVGQITPAKQLPLALQAFARLHADYPNARFHLVGEGDAEALLANLPPAARAAVRLGGYAPDLAAFTAAIAGLDVVINLRDPTAGETSGAALRALALGRPVIVTDHGWYAELPDAVALKTPPHDVAALVRAMQTAVAEWPQRSAAARAYARAACAPADVARQTIAFLEQIAQTVGRL